MYSGSESRQHLQDKILTGSGLINYLSVDLTFNGVKNPNNYFFLLSVYMVLKEPCKRSISVIRFLISTTYLFLGKNEHNLIAV